MAQQSKPAQDGKPAQEEATPRRGRARSIGGDAGAAANPAFARAGFSDPTLVLRWSEIVGPEVARLARPLRFSDKDGILTLLAEPAAALFLAHESRSLAGRINAWAGRPAISKVKFVQGRLSQPAAPPAPPRPAKAAKPGDPALAYDGPQALKAALQSLARWRSSPEDRRK